MQTQKYGRTYHFPFSEGATSDDKILQDWENILTEELVMTEKLDGENTCLKASGVYARSHGSPTRNPWAGNMWPIWERVSNDLGDLEVFGENLYGVHSIEYEQLPYFFFVFAIRDGERWLSWEEVLFYAELLELPTIPVLEIGRFEAAQIKQLIADRMEQGSVFGGDCEGFVFRNADSFHVDDFKNNVLKYVRRNHVKTNQHWTRNWQKAKLWYQRSFK
ncbi:MAG: RNA ligase family protein [Aureispira sp.]|nr:RNA ligase family protein [Aureispira sp.]